MALPEAVRRRADNARRLAHEANNPSRSQEQETVDKPENAPPEPQAADSQRQAPQPPEPPVEQAPATAPVSEQGFVALHDWEGRYKALRASRDEQRSSLEQENRQLKQELEELREQSARREAPEPQVNRFRIDDESREFLGDTEAKLFDQLASSTDERFAQLQSEQQKIMAENERREAKARTRFFEDLSSAVPNWKTLNEDPVFLQWLGGVDPSTGEQRQSLLNGFVDDHDGRSAANLFRSYASASPSAQQPVSPEFVPEPSTQRPASGGAEERLIAIYSKKEIGEFFEKKSRLYREGKLKGDVLAEIQAEEAEIRDAILKGHVR